MAFSLPCCDQVVDRIDFDADEAAFEIAVDHAGRLRAGRADRESSRRGFPSARR